MIDNRRVRFATIEGIHRNDVPIAAEVWLDDIYRAPWATRDAMKLAAHFVRYMGNPDPQLLIVSIIEQRIQLPKKDIEFGLKTLQLFGAVNDFAFERFDVSVSLNLSLLQRLRVLELRRQFDALAPGLLQPHTADAWSPPAVAATEVVANDTLAAPSPPPETQPAAA